MNYEGVTPFPLPPLYPLLSKEGKEGWSIWLWLCCSIPFVLCSRIFVEGAAGREAFVGYLTRTDFLKNEFKVNNDHKSRRDHRPRCICGRLDFLFRLLFVFPKFY